MSNVFEDQPDQRQSNDVSMPVSRFRPRYRALTEAEKQLHDEIKLFAEQMEKLYNRVKDSRYKSLAITSLEESVMWIIKGLTE